MIFYTLADIERAIAAPVLQRAQNILARGDVQSVSVADGGDTVSGVVRGSSLWPYKVVIHITQTRGGAQIEGRCTCPVGHNCKHVAAVAITALADEASSAETPHNDPGDAGVTRWLERLELTARPPSTDDASDVPDHVVYLLSLRTYSAAPPVIEVATVVARRLKSGAWGQPRNARVDASSTARYVRDIDARLLRWLQPLKSPNGLRPLLSGPEGARVLKELIATGRCHWRDVSGPPLAPGGPRHTRLAWETLPDGLQRLRCMDVDGVDEVLPLEPPWYLDLAHAQCGPLVTGLPDALARTLLEAPALTPEAVTRAQQTLGALGTSVPQPRTYRLKPERLVAPTPCLHLHQALIPAGSYLFRRSGQPAEAMMPLMHLGFDYDGIEVAYSDHQPVLTQLAGDELVRIPRDVKAEKHARQMLAEWNLLPISHYRDLAPPPHCAHDFTISANTEDIALDILDFCTNGLPALRDQGWRVTVAENWPFHIVEDVGDWYGDLEESGNDWFTLELGVMVDGQPVNLLPVLIDMLTRNPDIAKLVRLAADAAPQSIIARLPDDRLLPIPFERVRNILSTLVELYDTKLDRGRLRLPRLHAAHLRDVRDVAWKGGEHLRELAAKLRDFQGIRPVTPPLGLRADLRPYQRQGLDWLQFLREYELGGILADDMGLGKTVQALAHILLEKESGRMNRPCLVVAPTSLMTNWRMEAERFAPGLDVLVLHGTTRKQDYAHIKDANLVLTTYPLLPRDQEILAAHDYHLLILDEAQVVKNPNAKAAQVVREIQARHRLCLTGTPMENHLGELWSLFDFILPGLLGDDRRFRKLFRTPIEKRGDAERGLSLRRRIAPFMLRRTKQDVATELPPKTEIVRNVDLTGAQRDLYESIRLAMHEKVRLEITRKGLARSHIIILDALLKLRQVCCDPRLVKLASAKRTPHSAKLDLLMEMLPELVEEGRRILLFSQFTSMLAIIEEELRRAKIDYVLLTGQTRDRATPIKKFQDGNVPVFLVSLKAGGTGLNLTAADTVIHYDPWWNPAVETQATDRAHRIGQDKPVFVYKLVTRGTVEEKIIALQTRKKELADSLFAESSQDGPKLTSEDLDALFEPLA